MHRNYNADDMVAKALAKNHDAVPKVQKEPAEDADAVPKVQKDYILWHSPYSPSKAGLTARNGCDTC